MEAEIKSYVLDVIVNVMNYEVNDPVADDTPVGPGGIDLDSLSLLELMSKVEKEYGVKVADEDYEELATCTLGELVGFIERRRGARTA